MGQWEEYLEDFLSPTDTSFHEELEPGDPGSGSPVSGAKVIA